MDQACGGCGTGLSSRYPTVKGLFMAKVKRFEDLRIWQQARELTCRVFRMTAKRPFSDKRRLCAQIEAAAISVGSNIAEGFERGTRVQFIEFCYYAKGSAGEVRSQLYNALDAELITQGQFDEAHALAERCSAGLAKFIDHLKHTASEIPGSKFTSRADRFDLEEMFASHGLIRNPNGSYRQMTPEEKRDSEQERGT